MNTILKITLVSFAVLAFNSAFAQGALEKKSIKKAQAKEVRSSSLEKKTSGGTISAERQQQGLGTTQPSSVRQAQPAQVKTPAQRAKKPLKKQTVSRGGKSVKQNNGK